jgi:FtsH Extracellular
MERIFSTLPLLTIFLLGVALIMMLFQNPNPGQRIPSQDLSFSQLLNEVDRGQVRAVTIAGNEITGYFTDNRAFASYAPDVPTLVQTLYEKLYEKNVSITAKPPKPPETAPFLKWLTWGAAGWFVFWLAFLFVFPWSRSVQAVFFWNPKARSMLSLWFVPLLLFVLPPLRRRLLIPFREDLLAAAHLHDLPQLAFFGQGQARIGAKPPASVESTLQNLRGAVVIRGDAGLGKSSALRWYAARAKIPVAFLPARDCADGVDMGIARLIRNIQDTAFVRSMVYAGVLIVIVDGLNEVSADTREKIGAFTRDLSKGNVLIGTQPIEWTPPPSARIIDLLPLSREEAEFFLLSRPVGDDKAQKVHGNAYAKAVRLFLHRAFDEAPSEVDRQAAKLVLSNPFDLTFAADLLAQGSKPSAIALIDEAFRLADEGAPGEPGYRDVAGQPFPVVHFGRLAVAMRLEDRNWFKKDEFAPELPCLLERRLVVRRAVGGPEGIEERIQFRHDRVWDFFIAAAFRYDPDLWAKHLGDPRFRGAYLRIAETWEPEAAAKVRDQLSLTAAESGDHTTSDEFIKRLEARRRSRERGGRRRSEIGARKHAVAAAQDAASTGVKN